MPRVPELCGTTGCTALVRGKVYCNDHEPQRGWPRKTGNTRSTAPSHRARRERVLKRDDYRCQLRYPGCTGTATIVDHVVALRLGSADTDANCQGACQPCHRRKASCEGHLAKGNNVSL